MESAWSDQDARAAIERWGHAFGSRNEDIALRVYTSRLIGADPALVLHGGGNTSVKTRLPDELGIPVDVLCIKGSGWDLATIEPQGFPAMRSESLDALRSLETLSDEAMVNVARIRLLDAGAPNPSVEALLHGFLPHKFVDHSHADAVLAIVDQEDAETLAREIFGDTLAIVPYVMPGFALAKLAAEVWEQNRDCEGLLLLQHGLFTFGESARESYERHVRAVDKAQAYVRTRRGTPRIEAASEPRSAVAYDAIAAPLRGRLGERSRPYILTLRTSPAIRAFVDAPDLGSLSQRGPATPDHVIRTKPLPLVLDRMCSGADLGAQIDDRLDAYRTHYRAYVERQIADKGVDKQPLDPDPRVVLVPGLGLIGVGTTRRAASIVADLYEHTIDIIRDAEVAGRFHVLPPADLFDMEYWSLEQAKLAGAKPRALESRIVYITGAAGGIGAATARCFVEAGAHCYLVDRDAERVQEVADGLGCPWEAVDGCDQVAVRASVRQVVATFGGLDGIICNAGTAPQAAIATCPPELLQQSLQINLLAHQWAAAAATEVLREQEMGGFLLFNASKAAFNPGPGFGPYAIAKAGLVALMKQYAIEGGPAGIRSNAVNADRIRTGLLRADDVAARAQARGLSADAYYRANLLGREVTADDVAEAFLALALAPSTTGAVLTVDGGNIAASPR